MPSSVAWVPSRRSTDRPMAEVTSAAPRSVIERAPSVAAPLGVAAVTLVATAVVALHSPYQEGSYGFCPVLALTGWVCPTCGGLRAAHDLAHLDVAAAWSMNPAVVFGLPILAVLWGAWLLRSARGERLRVPGWAAWWALAAFVVFGVARNTPVLATVLGPTG